MAIRIDRYPATGNDTERWNLALVEALKSGEKEIIFPAGTYHFHPEGSTPAYCAYSNNDDGVKQIVFALEDLSDFTLSGEHAQFIFHGRVTPFRAVNCTRLTLRGFRIDLAEKTVTRIDIEAVGKNYTDVRIREPYRIENGVLHFWDDAFDQFSQNVNILQYDPVKREPSSQAFSLGCSKKVLPAPEGIVRFSKAFGKPGDCAMLKHQDRLSPAIVIDRCDGVKLEEISVYHSGGMGVLAQCSSDLTFRKLAIEPPDKSHLVSVPDDCLHCADCRGEILLDSCRFANSMDDAVNIHGIYRHLRLRMVGGRYIFLETGHHQQFGLENARVGDRMEFIREDTLEPYHVARLNSLSPMNKQMVLVDFEGGLPEEYRNGDCVRSLGPAESSLVIRNCEIRATNSRGILCSGMKNVLIEKNYIHTPTAAVYISGDANFWYEAGPVEKTVIRNNIFDHCCFRRNTDRSTITVAPELPKIKPDFYYHGRISIYNNQFLEFTRNTLKALSVDTLELYDNTCAYDNEEGEPAKLEHCRNVIMR